MEWRCMYITLLDMAIDLCEFLSDIKHPENHQLVSSTVLQLDKERRQACLEHNRRVLKKTRLLCTKKYSVEIENYSLLRQKAFITR